MAHEAADFDATLAAAAGNDAALLQELRAAFVDSLAQQVDLLRRSRCDGNWKVAAMRLKGLGASFHAPELVRLAEQALQGVPGEPGILRRLERLSADFTG
jgi:hypothetical protein